MMFKVTKSQKGKEELANYMYEQFKYCFSADSTERWVKMFAEKRMVRILDEQKEDYEVTLSQKFQTDAIKLFTTKMMSHIEELKAERAKKEKSKKNEVKRKKQKGVK